MTGSQAIPAGLHLRGPEAFHHLRHHPLVALWILEQAAAVAVEVRLRGLEEAHAGLDAPGHHRIDVGDEEAEAHPGWLRIPGIAWITGRWPFLEHQEGTVGQADLEVCPASRDGIGQVIKDLCT